MWAHQNKPMLCVSTRNTTEDAQLLEERVVDMKSSILMRGSPCVFKVSVRVLVLHIAESGQLGKVGDVSRNGDVMKAKYIQSRSPFNGTSLKHLIRLTKIPYSLSKTQTYEAHTEYLKSEAALQYSWIPPLLSPITRGPTCLWQVNLVL